MLQLRHRIRHIIVPKSSGGSLQDPNLKLMFNNIGFHNVIEIGEMETITLPGCKITGIPFVGEHSDLDIRTKLCHLVDINDFRILFAADSCNVESRLYEHIHKVIGDIDILYLGMECDGAPLSWLYGPLMPAALPRDMDHSRRLAGSNYPRGIKLVDIFNPKEVYVYAMGQEPWLNYIMTIKYTPESNPIVASDMLLAECKNRGLVSERLFGEKLSVYEPVS
jgi:L-ascorbate metabolism protein UlaG (beta-lactamase superfamily)